MPWSRVNTEYSIHLVQHTPSTPYTEYSIHRVQHTPSTASTVHSIHLVQHTLRPAYTAYCIIPRSSVSRSQPVSHLAAEHVVLNSPHSHNYKLTNEWSLSSCRASLPIYRLQIDRLKALLQSSSIMASKCISKLARSHPPSVSLNLHYSGLQIRTMTASKVISKLAQSRPRSSHDHSLQVHLQTGTMTAAKCISKLTRSRPPSASPNSLDHSIRLYL